MSVKLAKLPLAKPNDDLVQHLRDLLAQAERGDIRSAIVVKVYRNEDTQVTWSVEQGLHPILVLGALRMMMRDWEDRIIEKRGDLEEGSND